MILVILTCWLEAMVNVVIGMAMGTACMAPLLGAAATDPGVAGLEASLVVIEAGEAVITLVAVVEPGPRLAASFPAHWRLAPPVMMVAKAGPGRMGRPPLYSGFSCGGLAMSMWSETWLVLPPFLDDV